MSEEARIEGKRILIVDDEPDVLESLEEILYMCRITKAISFQEARKALEQQDFDVAILDIMGVNGYKLLDMAKERNILGIMLTAHALSPEETVKSYRGGAAFFVPKEEMTKLPLFLGDVVEAKEKGENSWATWLDRLGDHYTKRFGPNWQDSEKEFWDALKRQDWRLASVIRKQEDEM